MNIDEIFAVDFGMEDDIVTFVKAHWNPNGILTIDQIKQTKTYSMNELSEDTREFLR